MSENLDIPEGFKPLNRGGPFLAQLGPLYLKKAGDRVVIGLRIEERHTNIRGIAHGGMLVTLADSALGIALSSSRTPPQPMVTVNLSTDFVESAMPGDWVEAHIDIQRVGNRLAYANCYLKVGERRILRASGVFALMPPIKPKEDFEG
jgi:uncharacterized protein (TIGR00369 family)